MCYKEDLITCVLLGKGIGLEMGCVVSYILRINATKSSWSVTHKYVMILQKTIGNAVLGEKYCMTITELYLYFLIVQ